MPTRLHRLICALLVLAAVLAPMHPAARAATASAHRSYRIAIRGFLYNPPTLTIKAGSTVIWTNYDLVAHTVTATSGPKLDSGLIKTNKTYTHLFSKPGKYQYICTIHPFMKATLIVVK